PAPFRWNKYPWYTPRFWDGMRTGTWLRLMARHRWAWSPSRLHIALGSIPFLPFHSLCSRWQQWRWGAAVAATPIRHPPLFVLGHWRAGTTFLHELLVLDPRHTCPTTYDCFSPHDFLSTGRFISRWFAFVMPRHRPMDHVLAGWDRPQEDEFALLNMGLPSIYETLAFPAHGAQHLDYLDFAGLSPAERQRWKESWLAFLRRVNFRDPRRLVLKSPPHLGRIETLLELFPDAQFVHIHRDPYEVFASSLRLWRALCQTQSLQVPPEEGWEEFVLVVFERLYAAFERQRAAIPAGHLCEVRYEDLVADPLGALAQIYHQLGLGGLDPLRPAVQQHLDRLGPYPVGRHQ
ncbi:MAG: sulfotransferase, partial [Planctomycetales bacterium]|nr:sulfotransferase [Planctomycetales bacterium]